MKRKSVSNRAPAATHPLPAATASDLPRCSGEVNERNNPRSTQSSYPNLSPAFLPPPADPLRVGGEADVICTPVVLNFGLLGNQKRQSLQWGRSDAVAAARGVRCRNKRRDTDIRFTISLA